MPSPESLTDVLKSTLRVLVVEDESRYRDFLVDILREMGCEPVGAPTAMQAQQIISDEPPDIVILDLNLPVTDGMTFLKKFRQRQRYRDTPVIILTGVGDLKSAQAAIRHGVTDFLTKPCHLGQIEAALDRARRQLARTTEPGAALDPPAIFDETDGPSDDEDTTESTPRSIADLEREAILDALERHHGNRSAAAAALGISRRTLYNRLNQYRREGFLPDVD